MAGLTPKQNLFVAAYLKSLNATQAAIEAGYSHKGASSKGAQLLANVRVARCVDEALKRRAERVEVKADDVLRELIRFYRLDISKAYSETGALLPLHEIPEDVRRAIVGVETKENWDYVDGERVRDGETLKVKFVDKVRAVELAMKHLGLLTDKVKVEGTLSLEQLVLASTEKASDE